MESVRKVAVILFNLGGPDSKEAISPYLYNFFTDKNIIPLPSLLRKIVARRIARVRSGKEAKDSYAELGFRSPLLENTRLQARALGEALRRDERTRYQLFVSMRYWHPRASEVMAEIASFAPDHIVFLPLYPQFSTTTTWSSIEEWQREAARFGLKIPASLVCCYPLLDGFIASSAALIGEGIEKAKQKTGEAPRVLFSAHGLPEYVVKKGDPYQWQCEKTAKAIVEKLNMPGLDWAVCYQSKVGPAKWIGPSTKEEIQCAGNEGKAIVIYPHAFVSEHVETLVELDLEYSRLADELGVPAFVRVPAVSVSDEFIGGLAALVRNAAEKEGVFSAGGSRICPESFRKCCMNYPGIFK